MLQNQKKTDSLSLHSFLFMPIESIIHLVPNHSRLSVSLLATLIYAVALFFFLTKNKERKEATHTKHAGSCCKPKSTASGCRIMDICVSPPWRASIYIKKPSVTARYITGESGGRLFFFTGFCVSSTADWRNQPNNLNHNTASFIKAFVKSFFPLKLV